MKITLPFAGFYNSQHDDNLDRELEQMFSDNNGEANPEVVEKASFACNWSKVHKEYAKAYCENFANEFDLKSLTFDYLSSPREYNFTTDKIHASISLKDVKKIYAAVDKKGFAAHARETFTSRSGFFSFYSPDVKEWGPITKWDHNQVGDLLQFFVGDKFESNQESDLMERDSCNGSFTTWIENAIPNVSEIYDLADSLATEETQ